MPTIKNKSIITSTKLFKVEKLNIEFDNNDTREYEVISGTGEGAVMILPILNNELYFIKEYAAAIDDYSLTFPKGKIDKGELIIEAANRELQEEIGFKSTQLQHIYTLDLAPGYIDHTTFIVLAENLVPSKLLGDEPEELIIVKCREQNIASFLNQNTNIDSRALAALYIYNNGLNNVRQK